jgi:hypothetical protein
MRNNQQTLVSPNYTAAVAAREDVERNLSRIRESPEYPTVDLVAALHGGLSRYNRLRGTGERRVTKQEVIDDLKKLSWIKNLRVYVASESKYMITGVMDGIITKDMRYFRATRLPPVAFSYDPTREFRGNGGIYCWLRFYTRTKTCSWFRGGHRRGTNGSINRPHPHVLSREDTCFGDFQPNIEANFKGMNFSTGMCTVRSFLQTVNINDEAGYSFENFLVGDPAIRLYPSSTRPTGSTLRWSVEYSRWGWYHPTDNLFFISPYEYIPLTAPQFEALCDTNMDRYGQLCPSLESPMPDVRHLVKPVPGADMRKALYLTPEDAILTDAETPPEPETPATTTWADEDIPF